MQLLDLPNEVVLIVVENVESLHDMGAFSRASRLIHALVDPYLYKLTVRRGHSSALPWAAKRGAVNTVVKLLNAGVDVEAMDYGGTALDLAVRANKVEILQILVQRGANPNGRMVDGLAPLFRAALEGNLPMTRLLLENGASTIKGMGRPETKVNTTVLHWASWEGRPSVMLYLLQSGMDVNSRNHKLETPLHYAVRKFRRAHFKKRNIDTVEDLLEYGADKNARDSSGERPVDSPRVFQKDLGISTLDSVFHGHSSADKSGTNESESH